MRVHMTNVDLPTSGVQVIKEGTRLRIFFDFEEEQNPATDPDELEGCPDNFYVCENIDIEGDQSYGAIISGIVNGRYSNDDVQAIMANYELAKDETSTITEEKRAEYIQDYQTWQEWRAHAKAVAKEVMNEIGE